MTCRVLPVVLLKRVNLEKKKECHVVAGRSLKGQVMKCIVDVDEVRNDRTSYARSFLLKEKKDMAFAL